MPKKREKNATEYYKGKVREYEKEIKRLKRQTKEARKLEHAYEDKILEESLLEPGEKVENIALCTECGKGQLQLILNWENRQVFECNTCDFRKSIKL